MTLKWTDDQLDAWFTLLVIAFGPFRTWQARSNPHGNKKTYREFCTAFAKVADVGKPNTRVIGACTMQVRNAVAAIGTPLKDWLIVDLRATRAALEAGFYEESELDPQVVEQLRHATCRAHEQRGADRIDDYGPDDIGASPDF